MTIEIKVDDSYAQKIIELLKSVKNGAIKELKIKNNSNDIFDKSSGLLASLNIDPIKWQNEIRDEWNR
jgi:hypothetical protein